MSEWVEINKKKPPAYELVRVAYDNGKTQPCWWTGSAWDSGKPMADRPITAWLKIGNS